MDPLLFRVVLVAPPELLDPSLGTCTVPRLQPQCARHRAALHARRTPSQGSSGTGCRIPSQGLESPTQRLKIDPIIQAGGSRELLVLLSFRLKHRKKTPPPTQKTTSPREPHTSQDATPVVASTTQLAVQQTGGKRPPHQGAWALAWSPPAWHPRSRRSGSASDLGVPPRRESDPVL